jgi:hypothetical protein
VVQFCFFRLCAAAMFCGRNALEESNRKGSIKRVRGVSKFVAMSCSNVVVCYKRGPGLKLNTSTNRSLVDSSIKYRLPKYRLPTILFNFDWLARLRPPLKCQLNHIHKF